MQTRFRYVEGPAHTEVRVFSGPDADHLGLNGRLTFLAAEWAALRATLAAGERAYGGAGVSFRDDSTC